MRTSREENIQGKIERLSMRKDRPVISLPGHKLVNIHPVHFC